MGGLGLTGFAFWVKVVVPEEWLWVGELSAEFDYQKKKSSYTELNLFFSSLMKHELFLYNVLKSILQKPIHKYRSKSFKAL